VADETAIEELLADYGYTVVLRNTDRLWRILAERRIFVGWSEPRPPNVPAIELGKAARIEATAAFYGGGPLCSMGLASYSHSPLRGQALSIGRYCSIAIGLRMFGERHPIERYTSSRFSYTSSAAPTRAIAAIVNDYMGGQYDGVAKPTDPRPVDITIGHDVWIGQDVTLASGITLGSGCVVGAGSVVTTSVPAYHIWRGNPAQYVRMRFPMEIASRLLLSQWWNCHPTLLFECGVAVGETSRDRWMRPVPEFLDRLDDAKANGTAVPFEPTSTSWEDIRAALA